MSRYTQKQYRVFYNEAANYPGALGTEEHHLHTADCYVDNVDDAKFLALMVNDENIEVVGFAESKKDLIRITEEYIKNEEIGDAMPANCDIRWHGKGVYAIWARRFISDFIVARTTEIFEEELSGDCEGVIAI